MLDLCQILAFCSNDSFLVSVVFGIIPSFSEITSNELRISGWFATLASVVDEHKLLAWNDGFFFNLAREFYVGAEQKLSKLSNIAYM